MMRRTRVLWIGMIPILLATTAFMALASAEPYAEPFAEDEPESLCVPYLDKWVDPSLLILGETSKVTLVMTSTCPSANLPIDLVILADESNSMTPRKGRGIDRPGKPTPTDPGEPPTPDPNATPDPGGTPPGGGDATPVTGRRGGEPPFCRPGGDALPPPGPPRPTNPPPPTDPPGPEPFGGNGWPFQPPTLPSPTPDPGGGGGDEPPDIEDLEPSGGEDWVREIKKFVRDFVDQPEVDRDLTNGKLRLGFVSFNKRARIRVSLTDNASRITSGANKLRGDDVTRIKMGMREAERILRGTSHGQDTERVKVILILSDFQFCKNDMRGFGRSRDEIKIVPVGFGVRSYDWRKMYEMATKNEYVAPRHRLNKVMEIYNEVLPQDLTVTMDEVTVKDELAANMELIPGSVDPPTVTITGKLLEWQFAPPTFPLTLSYVVEPQAPGVQPVSEKAEALWTDSETSKGTAPFPDVDIECLAPTPTPTATSTPTATPTSTPTPTNTPTPAPRYLPILFQNWPEPTPVPTPTVCVPEEQTVDVGLVIDTSTSMSDATSPGGPRKLDAAVGAAQELVNLLKVEDQAAVVGFNSEALLATQLTSDHALITAALQSLPATQSPGTRIDKGLRTGLSELTSPRHKSANNRSIILVTDGRQSEGGNDLVLAAAQAIKAAEITLVTVGLGTDVDGQLLRNIASVDPDTGRSLYYPVPNAEDLNRIYREIARVIPCP